MRSKSYLFLLLVLVLGVLSGVGFVKLPFRQGLDISGGVRFTYRMDTSKLTADQKDSIKTLQERLISILQNRAVGPLGVTEPLITAKGEDEIVVELPGFSDINKAQEVIGTSASVEFYWARNVKSPIDMNRPYESVDSHDPKDITVSFRESAGNQETIGYLNATTKKPDPRYAAIIKGWGDPIISGDDLAKAEPQNEGQSYIPLLKFQTSTTKPGLPSAAERMRLWSTNHPRENLAAVLDGKVLSLAALQEGAVLSDNAIIHGEFPQGYVTQLVETLNSGALPVNLSLQSSEKVDPSIGSQALDKMVIAGAIAFGLISLYLIAYYAFPGFVAFIALSLYVLFTLTVLKVIGATFSLAGIAGFILSVGMAVDANILVFERFKEEVKSGKSLASAIELGFKRALPAIIDSNACTILTSLVLVNLGTGPVKGFATTLIIGVLISLFTAVTVTRSLLMFFVGSGIATNPKLYALNRNWYDRLLHKTSDQNPLQIVNTAKKWFAISLATIVICVPFFFLGGFKFNVEFQGGYETVFGAPNSTVTAPEIAENLEKAGLKGGNVKFATSGNDRIIYVTLPPLPQLAKSDQENVATIAQAAGLDAAKNRGFTKVGPAVQAETRNNAIIGVLVSSVLIVLYLAFRFGIGFGGFAAGLRFGGSAIGALIHDIFVVIGTAAIVGFAFGWEISALFLTALLTIIGFSVHDTIVIFDRIRENLHRPIKGEDFGNLVNRSITQSFARSINTSMTVIVTLAILVFFGTSTPDLKFFVVSMLIGIVSGTFSSIYNASPILYLWDRRIAKARGEEHSLVGMAQREVSQHRVITTQAVEPAVVSASGRSYGQVRRRANQPKRGIDIEE